MASLADKLRYLAGQPAFHAEPARVVARLGWWYVRSRIPRPALVRLRPWDLTLELPPRWRGVSKLAYAFRERYEPELQVLHRCVRPGSVAVDVGASYGIYTCVLARLVGPEGRVYAFEPEAEAAQVLRRNARRNRLGWVRVIQAACADSSGAAALCHERDPSRNWIALGRAVTWGSEVVEVVRLDDIVPAADFLKLDVEGAEELVLRGATDLLRRCRPTVLFEVNPDAAARLGLRAIGAWALLSDLGYRFARVVGAQLVPLLAPPGGGNVVALREA